MSTIYSRLALSEIKTELLLVAHSLEKTDMQELLSKVLETVQKVDEMDKDIKEARD
ncbi:hypothetical protein JOC54_002681 [Alkalihalobacillus xiaoxiensis]|uniref:Uncharacterized protein n=1 Tax=Shouchella xiaoxiensis TaxID=766895 RepID=A0ABS2SW64_9BACI|nr:hypothetical protein [Shouchella xiaoxiensis]MBM7839401.1 hypothetical protein [Shouchella xiaoxiensis]